MKQTVLSPLALRRAKVSSRDIAPKGRRVTIPKTGVSHVKMLNVDETSSPEAICEAMKEALSLCYPRRVVQLIVRHSRGWYQYELVWKNGVSQLRTMPVKAKGGIRWVRKTEMLQHIAALQSSARVSANILGEKISQS